MNGPPPTEVVALVLTFRRWRLATQVVKNLLEIEGFAPKDIILVINGIGGLEDPELEKQISVVRLPRNLGPAGGYYHGLREAAQHPSARWIYVCEDDVGLFALPGPRVARIVAEVGRFEQEVPGAPVGGVLAYGRDLNHRTGGAGNHQVRGTRSFEEVDVGAWGASLVAREVVEAGILPDPSWFFGYEDFDFWYKVKAAGFRLLVDSQSAAATERQMSSVGRDEAFAGERPVDADEPWRAYYVARNFLLLARRHGTMGWRLWHLAYSARRVQLATSRGERVATLRGLWDGFRGRTGPHPEFLRDRAEFERRS